MKTTPAASYSAGISVPLDAHAPLTIAMIVSTWPRLSQTFVLREFLGLEALGLNLRIFSIKIPPQEPVHAEVGAVRAPVTYLAFRCGWKAIFVANLRMAAGLGAPYFRIGLLGLRNMRYGNALHVIRQMLRGGYVADILRRQPVDCIHAHFATAPASVAMFASELSGIPYTVAVHANDIFVKARGRLIKTKLDRARAIVANNKHNRDYLLSRFGAGLDSKLRLVYNGLDLEQFMFSWPRAADAGPPLILSVGRMVEKKGLGDLVCALSILRDRGREFQAEIIGTGPLKEKTRNQIGSLHLEGRIKLPGAQPQEAVRAAYRRAAVFVLPCVVTSDGDRDGIPNVLYEAMASGVPVISTSVAGIPELIENGRSGILVEQRNPRMLADAIDELLRRPDLRNSFARLGRSTIEARFTRDRAAANLFELFSSISGKSVPNSRYWQ